MFGALHTKFHQVQLSGIRRTFRLVKASNCITVSIYSMDMGLNGAGSRYWEPIKPLLAKDAAKIYSCSVYGKFDLKKRRNYETILLQTIFALVADHILNNSK